MFLANDGVCPITPLTERLGAGSWLRLRHLPAGRLARTIPIWSTALLLIAGVLHARAAFKVDRR